MTAAANGGSAYRPLDHDSLRQLLASLDEVRPLLGGRPPEWRVREVGDGNLNLVFFVTGPAGSVCVKQALPYVRVAGPSWPMSIDRAFYENAYYQAVAPHVGGLIPRIYHYQRELCCTVMERLSPHVILRLGLIGGRYFPTVGRDIGEYVARASFFTSDLALPFERKFDGLALFAGNKPLVRITVDLVFADPYRASDRNRHTTPRLDSQVAALRRDGPLKAAAARWGEKFLCEAQALVHGDLHSGSVMVSEAESRVIDPEFAFYGPIGFDLGAFFGNLLLSWYSQPGHATAEDDRTAYRRWILGQAGVFWSTFRERFLALWAANATGDAFPASLFAAGSDAAALASAREAYVNRLFSDMLGFAACKMIRRIVGFAHVADFETISDPDRRADCEAGALAMARELLVRPEQFRSMEEVLSALPQVGDASE
ncbi:MAG: S-methyl-5-thioribose kinase [Proteobacteria bacterium]|nr:S-methyl-5-thioribose kinase [Pseudomonadota bacterium]